jgi:hypothetical protein
LRLSAYSIFSQLEEQIIVQSCAALDRPDQRVL